MDPILPIRIAETKMQQKMTDILVREGFSGEKATACAGIFTQNSLEGVYSHGVNRFSRFVQYLRKGYIVPDAEPELVHASGAIEQWTGNHGPGPLNAQQCTQRAMQIADEHGMGCVALAHTNHWMRGGTYGWQAARAGYVFIGWTNTIANMPAWGALENKLGNNPLVIAVPSEPEAVVLDMAMSQFSYGRLENYLREGGTLPVPGGYDTENQLTTAPGDILHSQRVLPIGFWKGAGLALLLDSLAALVSGGDPTCRIGGRDPEYGVSQVFIAIDVARSGGQAAVDGLMDAIVADLHAAPSESGANGVRYPGERVQRMRRESAAKGVPVDETIWERVRAGL